MKKILTTFMIALIAVAAFGQAERSRYYIEGTLEPQAKDGKFSYVLSDIDYHRIESTSGKRIFGRKTEDESVEFVFEGAKTLYPGLFEDVKFWKWQNNKWQIDSETHKGTSEFETSNAMTILLNLDCSSSIGEEDFEKLKRSAIEFIEHLYARSQNGGVKIGIQGFNTMQNTNRMFFPITGLDRNTKPEMIRFIRSLRMNRNTALYYSIKKAVNALENYSNRVPDDQYDGAFVVTFTDGIDNHSMDANIGSPAHGKDDPYFQHVKYNYIQNKTIKGRMLESYIIAVKGEDVGDNKLFESILEDLSTTLTVAKDFDELNLLFGDLADNLVERWQNLVCYVPPRFKGRVRWTLDISDAEMGKRQPDLDILLFNANLGMSRNLYYSHVFGQVGPYIQAGMGNKVSFLNNGYAHPSFGSVDKMEEQRIYNVSGGLSVRFGRSNFIGNVGAGYYHVRGFSSYRSGFEWNEYEEVNRGNYLLEAGMTYKLGVLGLHGGAVYLPDDGMRYQIGAGFVFGGKKKKKELKHKPKRRNSWDKRVSNWERSLNRLKINFPPISF